MYVNNESSLNIKSVVNKTLIAPLYSIVTAFYFLFLYLFLNYLLRSFTQISIIYKKDVKGTK